MASSLQLALFLVLFINTVRTSFFLRKDVEPEVCIALATFKMFNFNSVRNTHSNHT